MAQEEHLLSPTNHSSGAGAAATNAVSGGGGNNKSKAAAGAKEKKAPQRGLGVAQLEKIILDEQRKRESALQAANALANNAIGSLPSHPFPVHCPNFAPTNDNRPKFWKAEINPKVENFNPGYRLQYMATPSSHRSSSTVNASSDITAPSPVSSFRIEPPSNQSVRSNNSSPSPWPEECKMVGMKRSCPFSLEMPPVPSLPGNFHLAKSRSVESQGNPRYKNVRDGPSNSYSLSTQKPNNATTDYGRLNGDFLTLAPPSASSSPLNSDYSGHQGLQSQENLESQIRQTEPSRSTEEELSSFFLNSPEEKGEMIDLNLKL